MRYRKKPVVIEAEQFYEIDTPKNGVADYFMGIAVKEDENGLYLVIPTLEGEHRANLGDWIITGIKGELYPCRPDVFELTYEVAD